MEDNLSWEFDTITVYEIGALLALLFGPQIYKLI